MLYPERCICKISIEAECQCVAADDKNHTMCSRKPIKILLKANIPGTIVI